MRGRENERELDLTDLPFIQCVATCRDQTGDLFLRVLLLGWDAVAGNMGSLVRIQSIGHPN